MGNADIVPTEAEWEKIVALAWAIYDDGLDAANEVYDLVQAIIRLRERRREKDEGEER